MDMVLIEKRGLIEEKINFSGRLGKDRELSFMKTNIRQVSGNKMELQEVPYLC